MQSINQKGITILYLIILVLIVCGVIIYAPREISMCWTRTCGVLYHFVLFLQFLLLIPIIFTPHLSACLLFYYITSLIFLLNVSSWRGAVQSNKSPHKFLTPTRSDEKLLLKIKNDIIYFV